MSFSHLQTGSLCTRGLAICLVWLLSLSVWHTSAEATCGDYLMSRGQAHQPTVTPQQLNDLLGVQELPMIPRGCPNGECRSPEQAPQPVGSTVDRRTVDDVRSAGWLTSLKSQSRDSTCQRARPVDEPLPESPFEDALERPPQASAV